MSTSRTVKEWVESIRNGNKNLSKADLSKANLREANLYKADLLGANLREADLYKADLLEANLSKADLSKANLREANLYGAYLCRADLCVANLSKADLREANLYGADLRRATIQLSQIPQIIILPDGDLIGYKKLAKDVICKLRIPKEAKRSNSTSRKCRCEYAIVLEGEGCSYYNNEFYYKVGEKVRCDKWDDDWRKECSGGIHFFITKEEAQQYK